MTLSTKFRVICQFLFFWLTFVNFATAQTQQETLEWLQSKFSKLGILFRGNYILAGTEIKYPAISSFDDCTLTIKFSFFYRGELESTVYTTIPLINDITIGSDRSNIIIPYKGIKITVSNKDGTQTQEEYSDNSEFGIDSIEPNLPSRIVTALKHLSAFCSEKKEKF